MSAATRKEEAVLKLSLSLTGAGDQEGLEEATG